jgi:hypothetical protein
MVVGRVRGEWVGDWKSMEKAQVLVPVALMSEWQLQ